VSPIVNPAPPLGLGYLAAMLERRGCEVRIIDAAAPYAECSLKELVDAAEQFEPDLIGLTVTITFSRHAYALISELKKRLEVPIVAGGPHVTLMPGEALEAGADIVAIGEGEQTLPEIMEAIINGRDLGSIQGIAYTDAEGKHNFNEARPPVENLDELPFPARHLFQRDHYVRTESELARYGNIITSRGCPFECTYCSSKAFGRNVRFRSPENVVAEIEDIINRWGTKKFVFLDDCAALRKTRLGRICELIMEKQLSIRWICITRVDTVTPELLNKMTEAGCISLDYGIESGNPQTLKTIKKRITLDQARQALRWSKEAGIKTMVNFMHGFPWESPEDIRQTRRFIKEIRRYANGIMPSGILIPFPGTELYEEYKNQHNFDGWWRTGKADVLGSASKVTQPLFELIFFSYYELGFDFFHYSRAVKKEIMKTARVIGRHNLLKYSKRVVRLWPFYFVIREGLYALSCLSRKFYSISPALERVIMKPFTYLALRYQLKD
jgi:magnesium-protoporphyrin IX monomethyl ester (oxidative) cyclase